MKVQIIYPSGRTEFEIPEEKIDLVRMFLLELTSQK